MKIIESGRICSGCIRKGCFINKYSSDGWKNILTRNKTTFRVKAGERIFSQGEESKGIYTVYSGFIKVFDFDGKTERIVDLVGEENILGYRALGSSFDTYSVSAEALSVCEITFFSNEILNLAMESNKELAFFIIDLLTRKLRKAEIRGKDFQKLTAKEKVICSINDIIKTFGLDGECLRFTPKRKDLAALAGTTYETVVRVLSDLDKQKSIKIDGKKIKIIDSQFFSENAASIL